MQVMVSFKSYIGKDQNHQDHKVLALSGQYKAADLNSREVSRMLLHLLCILFLVLIVFINAYG